MLSSVDIFAALRWWAVLMVMGTAVFPFTFTLFKKLPDRGYAFTKMVGLLLVSYLFWIMGSLRFLGNNVGSILFSLTAVAVAATLIYRHNLTPDGQTLRQWFSQNKRHVLLTELLFLAIFALWVWVRAQNPSITATEKPMEFAFLNAMGRTPTFPPLDPWLSGFAISYYYFGYVMVSVLARLAVVPEAIAFNLGLAWLIAGTAIGAFGMVYNLIALRGKSAKRGAILLGILAAFALPIAGNQEIVLETMYANQLGSDQFWAWLDVRDLSTPLPPADATPRYETSAWWWWRSSRPINEYSLGGQQVQGLEPIAEFPAFSFVLGDMHPHVLALPFAFLTIAVAMLWWLESREWGEIDGTRVSQMNADKKEQKKSAFISKQAVVANLRPINIIPNRLLWGFTAVLLGGLSFLNTWDVLIYLFVVLAAYLLGQWERRGWDLAILNQTLTVAVMLVLPAILLYLPFYLGFRSQAGAPYILPTLVRPTRLPHFLIIFGMPLSVITILMISLTIKNRFQEWKKGVLTAVSLIGGLLLVMLLLGWVIASNVDGAGPILNLANELGLILPPRPQGTVALGWGLTAVFAIFPAILRAKLQYPGTTLLLTTLLATIIMTLNVKFKDSQNQDKKETSLPQPRLTLAPCNLHFSLLLIGTAALLTLGPEFVYLKDNFGFRLNTIFKFYYQAWLLFGTAAIVALDILWHQFEGAKKAVAGVATAVYLTMFLAAMQFPFYGVNSRAIEYRGNPTSTTRKPPTLNGLAYIQQFNPDEYDAILWLQENVEGTPVVLEATGGAYSNFGRVSSNTGLPTLLGWANHEYQWRGSSNVEPGLRDPVIRDIYSRPFWDNTGDLLNQYNIEYIYVGNLERNSYGAGGTLAGEEKFDERLEVAYQNNLVTIYRWHPQP